MKFSANLGFLWQNEYLPDAIRSAKAAGFDAVECHWPYAVPSEEVLKALSDTRLKMLGLNTRPGDVAAGDNGLAAIKGRKDEAQKSIDEAIAYAVKINAANVHVMAGIANGSEALSTFIANLDYACKLAAPHNIKILIEPLNTYDVPGYFLQTTAQAINIIDQVSSNNLKLMFDCYHVQLMEGNLTNRLKSLLPYVGHIQFASVPNRRAPGFGEIDYMNLFCAIKAMGWKLPLGAEYKIAGDTSKTLQWLYKARGL